MSVCDVCTRWCCVGCVPSIVMHDDDAVQDVQPRVLCRMCAVVLCKMCALAV